MKFLFAAFTLVFLAFQTLSAQNLTDLGEPINPKNITIVRDKWGVPHVFAKTDAEAAYGLAWANAEDAFAEMQEMMNTTLGVMGRIKGKSGAASDFFVGAIKARQTVDEKFESDLTPEFKRYLQGYCQGINAYAAKHPKKIITKRTFPLRPRDVVQAYLVAFSALCGVGDEVEKAMTGKNDKRKDPFYGKGSNAFAMNGNKTANGNTFLCINPHFLCEGAFSFYEAHIQSDEGLNITGAIFQGGTSIYMGNNPHLGWGKTWNYVDNADSYKLKMHHSDKLKYEYDGQWFELEKNPVKLKVKVGGIVIPVTKMAYWSHYGPTFQSPDKKSFYAVKSFAYQTIKQAQQYYYMNKAKNFDEFRAALDMQGVSLFNIVYADRESNIFYISNGLSPVRPRGINPDELLPGNRSDYNWKRLNPVSAMPQVKNPACGYVFNMNHTPFNATCEGQNDDRNRAAPYTDGRPGNNNRSERFMQLLKDMEKVSFEQFRSLKYDFTFPDTSFFFSTINCLLKMKPEDYPEIAECLKLMHSWDRVADTNSVGATVFAIALNQLFDVKGYGDGAFVTGCYADTGQYVAAVTHARDFLMKHYGTVEVPWGKVNRFFRLGKDFPLRGYPDALMANYSFPYKDGKFKLKYGDTYIHFVEFDKNGPKQIETLLPFNTLPMAEQYQDQLPLYNRLETKTMSLDRKEIEKGAVKTYQPE